MPKELGPPINSGDIIPEVRELAVAWNGHRADDDFMNTVKLASDIQYVAIDLLKQFADHNNVSQQTVDAFIKSKKEK